MTANNGLNADPRTQIFALMRNLSARAPSPLTTEDAAHATALLDKLAALQA